ncbi:uncharacterized protein LOC117121851 isoform X2 [Anneissia japonica]|nr:uncharacterized protein LOC117121851 isoform X2 [Anneissia japonica]XP_033123145.1 uncharacterized protein LOC117121851 isoform X2 [Anneissia japonica]XP_033123149.1 uncharacterized protein LOC117121851 isoform X2 [Anneissia japonica]XP_033123157.1 uncharacterized protein LOC117121851 isoform X2 [Anneissia japonica]
MGCLESKANADDTKLEIPRRLNSKHRNGSVRSKHDFGAQIGTPFSKKRAQENGKVNSDHEHEDDINENLIIRENELKPEPSTGADDQEEVQDKLETIEITISDRNDDDGNDDVEQPTDVTDGRLFAENVVEEKTDAYGESESVETSNESPITLQQKWLLQDSWRYIEKDLLEFGMIFFVRLLEQNPGLKNLWSFGKMNYPTEAELRNDTAFQDHSLRVMEMIGSAIGGLEDIELLIPVLSDLGQRHRMYGAKPEHFKAVHEALIYSYQKGLDQRVWTADVRDAWDRIIQTVGAAMSAELTD